MPPQSPMAIPRFSAGKAWLIRVSVRGITIAAAPPCTARAAISAPTEVERAAPAEATAKAKSPMAYIRRLPKRSPSAAPVSSRQAKLRL